jgi:hypothetical protein
MDPDENPYSPPESYESPSGERSPRKLFSFAVALELFVILAIVMTLISLVLPLVR